MHVVADEWGCGFGRCLTRAISIVAIMLVISAVPGCVVRLDAMMMTTPVAKLACSILA